MLKQFLVVLGCLVAFAANASAPADNDKNTVYRWVDEQGNVHFAQAPPAGIAAQKIKIDVQLAASPAPEQDAKATSQPEKASESKSNDGALTNIKQQLQQACEQAKKNLNVLQSFDRVRIKQSNGEYRFLSEQEKQAQIKQYQQQIKEACKDQ